MDWKDVESIVLPELSGNLITSAASVQEALVIINNYMVFLSQYEATAKSAIDRLMESIDDNDQQRNSLIMEGQLRLGDIPDDFRKNKELTYAYIVKNMYRKEMADLDRERKDLRQKLGKANDDFRRLDRKLKQCKTSLEVGRSILSSLKSEMQNSNI